MTDGMKRMTRALAAPLYDEGESGISFSKTVAAVIVAVWVLTVLARVVVTLVPHEGAPTSATLVLPGFQWEDVAIIALVIVASHGRSMVRTLLHRTSIGIGKGGPAAPDVSGPRASGSFAADLAAASVDAAREKFGGAPAGDNLFVDDERGDFTERERV